MMDGEWAHVGLDLLGMAFIAGAFVWAIKSDTKVLSVRMSALETRLEKMDMILEKLSDQKGRIDVLDERMLAQGKRVDEVSKMMAQVAVRYSSPEYNKEQES